MKQFITAWQFLTIIPIKRSVEATSESLGKSMAYFPVVGFVLGLLVAALDIAYSRLFPSNFSSALLLASYIAMYGGFHLDGLVDTVDGLVGGRDREHALKIMKESTIGAIGVVTLVLLLLLKYAAIGSLSGDARIGGLILMPVLGRWASVIMVYGSGYAREGAGLGKPFTEYVTKREVIVASLLTIVISWVTLKSIGLLIVLATLLLGLGMKSYFKKRIGGITGDMLGFGGELSELLMLMVCVIKV
ncbi:MAG: adenosylcobinamide-GDP ribazoletransferase [Deltaproteobacteria bacterium]|nr:adenosylcobinamide-GDP ribazoletransferase [Deltaproteobacteria bacterium]